MKPICHLTVKAVVGSDGRFYVESAEGRMVPINDHIVLIDYDVCDPNREQHEEVLDNGGWQS